MDINCKINGQSIVLDYCDTNEACEITRFLQFTHLMCTKVTCVPFSAAARIHIERALVILMGTADAHQHHQNTTRSLPDRPRSFICLPVHFDLFWWANLKPTQKQLVLHTSRPKDDTEGRSRTAKPRGPHADDEESQIERQVDHRQDSQFG